jgi:predicted peptidase
MKMKKVVLLAALLLPACTTEPELRPLAEFDSTVVRRAPGRYQLMTPLPSRANILYTLYVPEGVTATSTTPVPLVVAAHFGGQVTPWLGGAFTDLLVAPGLTGLGAIIVAPDAGSTSGWSEADEVGVLWLAKEIARVYPVDARKVLMTGYSAGGAQTWLLANRHQDFFTAALPMSARPRQNDVRWRIPIFVIHSENDELIPFETVQTYVNAQLTIGATIRLRTVTGLTHYQTASFVTPMRDAVGWLGEVWPR